MRGAPDIADLPEKRPAQRFLDLQVVVVIVRCPEILADGEDIENLTAAVAGDARSGRRNKQRHTRRNRETVVRNRLHRRRSGGISFQTVRSSVAWTVV